MWPESERQQSCARGHARARYADLVTTDHRYLPMPSSAFVLHEREALGPGLRRVTLEQFDRSIAGLQSQADVDAAVHETRKSIKRLRAVLRLIRGEIGEEVYRAENVLLRDTSRLLAPIRDGRVMVDTVTRLRTEFATQLAPTALSGIERALIERHRRRRERALDDETLVPVVVTTLRSARARYGAWPVDSNLPAVYGRAAIRDRFEAIAPGLDRTYRRGRRQMEQAATDPSATNFHQWRKRVKYFRHQVEVLEPLWPEVLTGLATSLDRLGEILGEEHDLAVLVQLVSEVPTIAVDPIERSLMAALAQHRRARLQQASLVLGMRVYAETPNRFVDRIERYWDARAVG